MDSAERLEFLLFLKVDMLLSSEGSRGSLPPVQAGADPSVPRSAGAVCFHISNTPPPLKKIMQDWTSSPSRLSGRPSPTAQQNKLLRFRACTFLPAATSDESSPSPTGRIGGRTQRSGRFAIATFPCVHLICPPVSNPPGVISRRLSVSSPLHRRPSPSEALPRSPLSLTLPVQVFQRSSGAECDGDQQDNKQGGGKGGRIGEVKKQRAEVQV